MGRLAAFVMQSRGHAAASAALLGVLGWLLPFLLPLGSCLSGAVVGLVSLRYGPASGLLVVGLAGVLAAVLAVAGWGTPKPALALVAAMWLPVWLGALVLRYLRNQGAMMLTVALLALVFAGGVRLVTGNATAWWRALLEQAVEAAKRRGGGVMVSPGDLDAAAAALNSMVAASATVTLAAALLLARWWQAVLYNPGGFGREFRGLRLPRAPVLAGLAAVVALALAGEGVPAVEGLGRDLAWVGAAVLAFQGLALIHHQAEASRIGRGWLVALYAALLFQPPYVGLALAAIGLADVVMDLRGRLTAP